MKALPGSPYPLGASWDGEGVNFALYSENATAVELCLFDAAGSETRVPLRSRTAFTWHAWIPDIGPGQRYGYRVYGPWEPERGLRFDPDAVLLDPYAKALDGPERWDEGCFSYADGDDLVRSDRPKLGVPRGVVIDPSFDWEGDEPPRIPLHRSVIYEAHVRGLTMRHPGVPEPLRGTYAGVAHPAIVRYLQDLGVTAIELMPVHAFVDDQLLLDRGLRNYWGYNTIGFFAPDVRYRSGAAMGAEVAEFKSMVKALHRAGIEVILDVVYNHTAEGNHLGPTFHLKGIDNPTYYRLVPDNARFYFDTTGTGNTLNAGHRQTLTLIMDSLRYWATEMHVDGFRFDLAASLARQLHEVDQLSSFFALIHQSPSLSDVKLIAEPWDVGEGGYQVGNFPVRWAEWNGRFRDAVRALWRGEGGKAAEIGYRLTGSSDLYQSNGRAPYASINLVTAHDGFTLRDLVSYDHKHNEANGEGNRDGNDHEGSWNCGVEGPTDDPDVLQLRARQQRNLLATLILSQGTPMLVAGDEIGRTQRGNNNAYCQDNETSWIDWDLDEDRASLLRFTKKLLALKRAHPALRRSKFFQGREIHGDVHDLLWLRTDGEPMSDEDWDWPSTRSLGMFLAGRGIDDVDEQGRPLVDDNLLLLVNASAEDVPFRIPPLPGVSENWRLLLDTADDGAEERRSPGDDTVLVARSVKLFLAPSRVIRSGGAKHTLGATYRLQLGPGFGFRDAERIVPYLADLGVTDVYLSPIFEAVRGSTHGYDVVDHGRLAGDLGTRADFEALSDTCKAHGLGVLVDWVPNHMGIASGQNRHWDDVLEHGPASVRAEWFDVDWCPARSNLEDRVLLPVLGRQYGEVLEQGELRVVWEDGRFQLAYFDRRLPLAIETVDELLGGIEVESGLPDEHPARMELESLRAALRHLPSRDTSTPEARRERARETPILRQRFARLAEEPPIAEAIPRVLAALNGTVGVPESFDALDRLLCAQSYRLASWRVAAEEINYRRFFDINDLAALRMERPQVFAETHALLFELVAQDRIQGLRLDHTDGLYDPYAYFEALQRHRAWPEDGRSPDDLARPMPILVEKILEPGEQLPPSWPVDGTTGYELANAVIGVLVDREAEGPMTSIYQRFTGDNRRYGVHVYESKRDVLRYSFASEMNMLGRALERIASSHRRWRDFTVGMLSRALREVVAAFPVYRTYLRDGEDPSDADEARIRGAIRDARRRDTSVDASVYDFLEALLLRKAGDEHAAFVYRFQQLTGPVMAKSVEDTAFYRYGRLVCLNEVGGLPSRFGIDVDEFHRQNHERARAWPLSMVTTATHDTKRGEDTAARIAVLSEIPGEWQDAVRRWSTAAASARTALRTGNAPSAGLEYQFYQSLVGVWPVSGDADRRELGERLSGYLLKAAREAKQETSWVHPDPAYEDAIGRFVRAMLADDGFVADVREFCARIAPYGAANGLASVLLRTTVPGVPDTYQGTEVWSQTLVDPDNRRPVDFGARAELLRGLGDAAGMLASYEDGAIKAWVLRQALRTRREHRDLFLRGDYEPIAAGEHAIAFTRGHERSRIVVVAARHSLRKTRGERPFAVGDVWTEGLRVPFPGRYRDVLTGREHEIAGAIALSEVLAVLPVALLVA